MSLNRLKQRWNRDTWITNLTTGISGPHHRSSITGASKNKEEHGTQMEGGLTRALAGSSLLHTPGFRPSLLDALPKTRHNQITRNIQQGNTISPPVTSTPCFLEILAETDLYPHRCTACNRSWAEPSFCCHPSSICTHLDPPVNPPIW